MKLNCAREEEEDGKIASWQWNSNQGHETHKQATNPHEQISNWSWWCWFFMTIKEYNYMSLIERREEGDVEKNDLKQGGWSFWSEIYLRMVVIKIFNRLGVFIDSSTLVPLEQQVQQSIVNLCPIIYSALPQLHVSKLIESQSELIHLHHLVPL